ncbi:MAG: energy transducer TonB [Bacteroidetes bacterium]|nr:energy transducer TonB [Bacteroidota bacterium]
MSQKILPLLLFLFSVHSIRFFGQTKEDSVKKVIEQTVFAEVVEVPASFKGDTEGLKKFIVANLKVPQKVKEKKLKGYTYLQLGILKDGTAVVLKILKGLNDCQECDQVAIDLIKVMPKWNPAKMSGKSVATYWNLPIEFSYKK